MLGILNTLVRPIVKLLALPLIALTLGLFLLVINAAMSALASWLLPKFHVDGYPPGMGGSIIISIVGWLCPTSCRTQRRLTCRESQRHANQYFGSGEPGGFAANMKRRTAESSATSCAEYGSIPYASNPASSRARKSSGINRASSGLYFH